MNSLSSEVRFWETWFHESLFVLTHALTIPYTCVCTDREWGVKRDTYIFKGMRKSLRKQGLPSNLLLLTDFSQQLKQLVGTSQCLPAPFFPSMGLRQDLLIVMPVKIKF